MKQEPIWTGYDINGHNEYKYECCSCGTIVARHKYKARANVYCRPCELAREKEMRMKNEYKE